MAASYPYARIARLTREATAERLKCWTLYVGTVVAGVGTSLIRLFGLGRRQRSRSGSPHHEAPKGKHDTPWLRST
jgi:hypothetical protein